MAEPNRQDTGAEQQRRLESRLAAAAQQGDRRHNEANARLGALEERLATIEQLVGTLEAELAAHQRDDKRHTGKLGGAL
jgi:uncharacterized membrane protein YccC